ncbi:MAG: hypothetical protein K5771_01695 [Oscillospiraceae bacterium]|nr:hypothetical protein [Oscillospiraceae bacterium]
MSLATIVESNDNLAMLRALRRKLAETIDTTTSARDLPALCRQLQSVSERITELEAQQSDDPIGEILKERSRRPLRDSNRKTIYQDNE